MAYLTFAHGASLSRALPPQRTTWSVADSRRNAAIGAARHRRCGGPPIASFRSPGENRNRALHALPLGSHGWFCAGVGAGRAAGNSSPYPHPQRRGGPGRGNRRTLASPDGGVSRCAACLHCCSLCFSLSLLGRKPITFVLGFSGFFIPSNSPLRRIKRVSC